MLSKLAPRVIKKKKKDLQGIPHFDSLRWKTPKYVKKNWKNITVVFYAKIIVEFVSVVSFYFSFTYIYGKMVFLMAHRFLFSLVMPLSKNFLIQLSMKFLG